MSLNPIHGEVYSIQHYVIKFISDLRQVGGFLWGTAVSSTNRTECHNITEILLKVALNVINKTKPNQNFICLFICLFISLTEERIFWKRMCILVGENWCDVSSIFYNNIQCIQLSYRKKRNKNTGKNKIVPMKIRKFAIDIYICVFCIGIYNLHPLYIGKQ